MTALSIAAATLLSVAVWLWVLLPLWRGHAPRATVDPRLRALLEEREAALLELSDLEDDRRAGRLSAADYERLREVTMERGAKALAGMDKLRAQASRQDGDATREASP